MNQNVAILNRPLKKYMMEFIKTFKEYKIKKKTNHFNKYKLPSYAHCLFQISVNFTAS